MCACVRACVCEPGESGYCVCCVCARARAFVMRVCVARACVCMCVFMCTFVCVVCNRQLAD